MPRKRSQPTAPADANATTQAPKPRSSRPSSGGRIFVAKQSFSTVLDGVPVMITANVTRVREGHKLLAGREEFFEPLTVQYDIEQATAGPGEQR